MDTPDQVGQKHLCQQADQFGKENFKLGMTGEGDDDRQSTEEAVDQAGKKRTMGRRNLLVTNRAERGPLQAHAHKYVNVYRTVSREKLLYLFWEISMTG